jgi:hypothetical protein
MTTTFALGGDLQVDRLGFGTIRLVMSGFDARPGTGRPAWRCSGAPSNSA